MTDHEKTSRDYLEAWRTSQAEMQRLRDALEAEREKVRVLREALENLLAYVETGYGDFESDEGAQAHEALATTEDV